MAITIRDVARKAGVSVATVSRVLNNSGPVAEETRLRIAEVARELSYTPNSTARSLSMQRTSAIGVLLPEIYGEFFSEVIRGVDQAARRKGYHVLVSSSHSSQEEIEAALRAMRGRVDGLILLAADVEITRLLVNLPSDIPLVLLNADPHDSPYDTLIIDNYGGARAVVEHLLGLGHRRIGLIRGAERNHDARERTRGYVDAMREAGMVIDPSHIVTGDFTESGGHRAARELLAVSERPTAVFASNDSMAIGALSAAEDAGLEVPEDLAVVGFDDVPIAQYVSPPLTTVRVAIAELGSRAVSRLLTSLQVEQTAVVREVLRTEVVVRRSCGASNVPQHGGRTDEVVEGS